jgi:hypothetical protein
VKPLNEWAIRELLAEIDRYNRYREFENWRHATTAQYLGEQLDQLEAELKRKTEAGITATAGINVSKDT